MQRSNVPESWVGKKVVVSPSLPDTRTGMSVRPDAVTLEEVNDRGICVSSEIVREDVLEKSFKFYPWSAVPFVDLVEIHRELTFDVDPVRRGETGEQSLTTIDYDATVLSVSYTPAGPFLFWNDDIVCTARSITLSKRRRAPDRPFAAIQDAMVAWVEDVRPPQRITPGEEFLLPLVDDESSLHLKEGDELYWVASSISDGDPEGDPGGVVKVVLAVHS